MNGPLEDSSLPTSAVDPPGNEVGLTETDLVRFDHERPSDAARRIPEERGHGAVGPDLVTVEESLVHVADGIHHQEEAASLPFCRDLYAGSIPSESRFVLPSLGLWNGNWSPFLKLGQGRGRRQQTEEKSG
jgi:hypothetical protein